MARVAPILPSLNGGEWSPRLYGRVDLQKYPAALRRMINFVGLSQGAATRRPGTHYVANTKGNKVARLAPFEFSTVQAYMLEFTDLVMRVFKDRGIIESSPGVPLEVVSPYGAALLAGLKWAQSADTMYICSPSKRPYKLTRTSHTSWSFTAVAFLDGPYLPQNTTATTLALSSTSGSVTVTASSTTGINGGAGFASTDVGRLIRFLDASGAWTWLEITAFTDTTHVTATVKGSAASAGTAVATWRLGAWSDTTGWPSCVSFFQERLFFAATSSQPQTAWASKSGDYENFQPTTTASSPAPATLDDNAITLTISDDRVNAIRWMSAGRQLVVGTVGGEFTIAASNLNEAITPSNATVKRETTRGCADLQPVRVGQAVLFVQRARRKIFEMAYNYEVDAQVAPDMTLLADHLFRSQVAEVAYQAEPWSMLWAVRADGLLLGFVYLRDQSVTGWSRHPLGGTGAKALSVACIPGDGQDELWLVVERTVNGSTVRHVEYLAYEFYPEDDTDKDDAFFVDAGLTYDGAAATTLTGLTHLEGETVQVLADGAAHPDCVVSGGAISLQRAATRAHVGLAYTSTLETMDIEQGAQDGTAQGRRRRIHELGVKFWATLGAKVGRDGNMDRIEFRRGSDPMDASPPLFTGEKRVPFPPGWDVECRVVVEQDQPLPCTVTALVPHMNTHD